MFCKNCGKKLDDKAVICVKCGVPVRNVSSQQKSRNISIVLAILLGKWTWLYTFKKDAWKFLTAFMLEFFGLFIGFTLAFFGGVEPIITMIMFALFTWLWSVVDVCTKSDKFYDEY